MEFEGREYPDEAEFFLEVDDLTLTWFNTTIRTFADPQFNHVEHTDENGGQTCLIMNDECLNFLMDQQFPISFHPVVDANTQRWMLEVLTRDLEVLTPEMFGAGNG